MSSFRRFFILVAAVLPSLPAASQTPPAPPAATPPIFGEEIEVRVVNVEAVVTDRRGNRVPDLKLADFRLRVDGKEVPIEYFTEVRGGQAVAPAAAGQTAPAVPGLASLAPGSPVGTSYLVFVDDFFAIAERRNQVLRALQDDLGRLGPEDRMAIVAYDGRKLDMVTSWSSSAAPLERALRQAMTRPARGLDRLTELRTFESSQRFSAGAGPGAGSSRTFSASLLSYEEREYAQRLARQIEDVVEAAASTLRGFAAPPGRKVMLLLSGGWPFRITDYVVNSFERTVLTRDVPEGEQLLRPLTRTANLLGYTLYPVDVPGVEVSGTDASVQTVASLGSTNVREQEMHASLELLAKETGGRALLNGLRESSLEQAAGDTRSYYWLGFTPQRQRNDARHEIRVEVRRPGLAVRARDSFFDFSRRAETSMQVESAMLFGNPPENAPLPVEVGKPLRAGKGLMEVPIKISIPAEALTVVETGGKHVAQVELRIAAVDERGGRSEIPVIPIDLAGDKPPAPGTSFPYETRLRLRALGQHLVIAIFDPLSGRISTAEVDVAPEGERKRR
jgi:VWFA-related protein